MSTANSNNNKRKFSALQELPLNREIWVHNIMPFIGIGHFAYVAAVNRQMKDMYLAYCSNVEDPPYVCIDSYQKFDEDHDDYCVIPFNKGRVAVATDTFYQKAVFSSVACAEYWDSLNNQPKDYNISALIYIAQTGNQEVFQWAHQKKFPWSIWVCDEAVKHGHLSILKYAHDNGCPWTPDTSMAAARYGQLECLKYAHENGCPWEEDTCQTAARSGQLECLKYAHENGCPWDEGTCISAAAQGHLECLKYAHENECPWNESTCAWAAENGNLECLKYAHENGCPWDANTCINANRCGHLECWNYARENGCPSDIP